MKIRPVRAELFRADGRTERQDEDKCILNFAIPRTRLKILRSAHTVLVSFSYGSPNKQRLFQRYTNYTAGINKSFYHQIRWRY
jgi:hypothetical protein